MAYPDPSLGGNTEGGMCPQSHPVALFSIGAEAGWDLTGIANVNSSLIVFANGDTTGFGYHADFVQGWTNLTALNNSFATCFNSTDCPWRSFGTPNGQDGQKLPMSPQVPAPYEEQIGLNGPISQLPGNNPVYGM
jgi:hypothetical protein